MTAGTERFEGAVALVTGAACPPGIGRAVALRLAAGGARVVCTERVVEAGPEGELPDTACAPRAELHATVQAIRAGGGDAIGLDIDLATSGGAQAAVAAAVETYGQLDLCANVEGGLGAALGAAPLLDLDRASWDRCLETNLTSAWAVAVAAGRRMVAQQTGGSIVLLSSAATNHAPHSGVGAFAAAKAGVDRLVRDLADELGPHQVRVNGVRPLGVDPNAAPGRNPHLERLIDESGSSRPSDLIALGRFQHPDETAAVVTFLLSSEASFVSGSIIDTHGGARLGVLTCRADHP